jgi:ABC-2 type transport system permease protein
MVGTSLYIIVCSARNRLRVRLRRLREPRYLVGAFVGAAYVYFSFFARLRAPRSGMQRRGAGRAQPPVFVLSAVRAAAPGIVGIALLAVTAAGWLFPFDSGLLDFSEAEVQFLFPAPVSRRSLLVHRLTRSQLGLLFSSLVAGVVMPSASGFSRLRVSGAAWLLLCTAKMYFTGISLARARLGSLDARTRRVAWLPLLALTAAVAIVAAALARAFSGGSPASLQELLIRIGIVTDSGLSRVVLWPFIALARPLFAPWPGPYLESLAWSGAVLAATILWVLRSDSAFQDAAEEAAARRTQEARPQAAPYGGRLTAWRLAPAGRPEGAFAWKAALQMLRVFDRRAFARIAAILFALIVATTAMGRSRGVAGALGAFSIIAALFSILLAPQVLRIDLRQDLRHLELLKTWPVKPPSVIRGELLWPGIAITAIAWMAIAIGVATSAAVVTKVSLGWRVATGAAAGVLAPAFVFMQLTIQNGVALIFPAWVPLGSQRPRGLDAMGQRLIMLGATWLLLVVGALPGAIAAAVVWFALGRFVGPAALLPAAAVCTAIMAIEVLLATEMLGPAYERIDITAVERAE